MSYELSYALLIAIGVASAVLAVYLIRKVLFERQQKYQPLFKGKRGQILDSDHLTVAGQTWLYTSDYPVKRGEKVKILAINGSVLTVKPLK